MNILSIKEKDINNFTAYVGSREETQLDPLIATRVIFPVDLGFQNCLFIFIHSKRQNAAATCHVF